MVSIWTFSTDMTREESSTKLPTLLNKIIDEQFYGDPSFVSALSSSPMKGASDYGKPYLLFLSSSAAILVIRESNRRIKIYFARSRSDQPLKELTDWLENKFGIYAIRGRISPMPPRIRKHLLELLLGVMSPPSEAPEKPVEANIAPAERAEKVAPEKSEKPEKPENEEEEEPGASVEI